jgi:hypothetical protein
VLATQGDGPLLIQPHHVKAGLADVNANTGQLRTGRGNLPRDRTPTAPRQSMRRGESSH